MPEDYFGNSLVTGDVVVGIRPLVSCKSLIAGIIIRFTRHMAEIKFMRRYRDNKYCQYFKMWWKELYGYQ